MKVLVGLEPVDDGVMVRLYSFAAGGKQTVLAERRMNRKACPPLDMAWHCLLDAPADNLAADEPALAKCANCGKLFNSALGACPNCRS
jgi:hypothetical protein